MDLKTQIIQEYLTQGGGFRKLAEKYGISRTTICKWVMIYQGIHILPLTKKQQKHSVYSMSNKHKKLNAEELESTEAMQQKIAALEKQLEWEKLLIEHNAMISMTDNGDPLENAIAERVNGILKTELISSAYSDM